MSWIRTLSITTIGPSFAGPSTLAWAHPGHGVTPPDSPVHFIVEPAHAWWLLTAGVCLGAIYLYQRRARLKHREAPAWKARRPDETDR